VSTLRARPFLYKRRGLASIAGGGKFANAAIAGAFGYLFNEVAGTFNRSTGLLTLTDRRTGSYC
jgi:hypothetical protein